MKQIAQQTIFSPQTIPRIVLQKETSEYSSSYKHRNSKLKDLDTVLKPVILNKRLPS
jgi:hypothetical protein